MSTIQKPERGATLRFVGGPQDGCTTEYRGVGTILCTRRMREQGELYRLTPTDDGWAFVAAGPSTFSRYSRRYPRGETS